MLSSRLSRSARIPRAVGPWRRLSCPRAAFSARLYSATPAQDGPVSSETNRAEATKKRFWNDVGLEKRDSVYVVTLDKRPLKTPSGKVLALPENKSMMASLIAAEWDHQETLLKPHALPATSVTARAIDGLAEQETRSAVQEALLKYLDTDTICFYQDYPPQLERLQAEHWDPLLEWARKTYDVEINKAESILFCAQPEATKEKFRQVIAKFDQWQLAALERATYTTKSFIIGLALVTKHLTVEQAALAATVEVCSQIERWGEVEDTHDVDYHDYDDAMMKHMSVLMDELGSPREPLFELVWGLTYVGVHCQDVGPTGSYPMSDVCPDLSAPRLTWSNVGTEAKTAFTATNLEGEEKPARSAQTRSSYKERNFVGI
ncbi:hypothetical protein E4T56_gene19200 [Termitomyces sp. T112]|nr:hypothetical protein E4T56_gene19200 [Termitomyces sp. T112]